MCEALSSNPDERKKEREGEREEKRERKERMKERKESASRKQIGRYEDTFWEKRKGNAFG
jgi:hypothetical protein